MSQFTAPVVKTFLCNGAHDKYLNKRQQSSVEYFYSASTTRLERSSFQSSAGSKSVPSKKAVLFYTNRPIITAPSFNSIMHQLDTAYEELLAEDFSSFFPTSLPQPITLSPFLSPFVQSQPLIHCHSLSF